MKLKEGFILHNNVKSSVLIDLNNNFKGIVKGNETFAEVIEYLKNETTVEEIISNMLKEYEVEEEVLRNDILKIIDSLKSINALDE